MPERLEVIRELLAINGLEVGPRGDRALEVLDAWLHDRAMAHGTELWNIESPFLSLVHDVGTLYGDELIARYPNLHWTLRRGAPTNIVNHHTVVAGYTRTKRKTYSEELIFGYIQWLKAEFDGAAYRPVWMPLLATAKEFA